MESEKSAKLDRALENCGRTLAYTVRKEGNDWIISVKGMP